MNRLGGLRGKGIKMTNVVLVRPSAPDPSYEELVNWFNQAGCEIAEIRRDSATVEPFLTSQIERCEVLVFLLLPDLDGELIAKALNIAKSAGKKVVAIRLPSGSPSHLPVELEKYGSSVVPWNARTVLRTVCGDDEHWTDESGDERPEPTTKRNKCRPKKKKAEKDAVA